MMRLRGDGGALQRMLFVPVPDLKALGIKFEAAFDQELASSVLHGELRFPAILQDIIRLWGAERGGEAGAALRRLSARPEPRLAAPAPAGDDGAMDEAPFPDDEEDAPPPPPAAFGLPAEPFGCSLVAGIGFMALMAPLLVDPPNVSSCVEMGGECVPVGDDLWAGLALAALLGLAFGVATGALVRGRLRAWREGRRVRPALWVAFVALFAIASMAASLAMAPVQWLLAAVG